ncbi:MAG: hypothetical protein ACRDNF_06310, partial [Streptosporangiaceae bacterium]
MGPVRLRIGQADQHPVGRVHGHPGQHDRRRLIVADQRAGGVPEDLLQDHGRDPEPPLADRLPRGDAPVHGERDAREQPREVRMASACEEPGSRVIAMTSRTARGYDISRRRSRRRSRGISERQAGLHPGTPWR